MISETGGNQNNTLFYRWIIKINIIILMTIESVETQNETTIRYFFLKRQIIIDINFWNYKFINNIKSSSGSKLYVISTLRR